MKGKEIVEILFSKLSNVIDFRIESEYFEKRFLTLEEKIRTVNTKSFLSVASAINGRPYNSEFFNTSEGVYVSKIGDVTNKRDCSLWEFVSEDEFKNQKGKYLNHGDILMTLTGDPPDIGKVNYVCNPYKATWNQRVAKIQVKDKEAIISNEVAFAILSIEFSRSQLERYAKGIRQRNLGNESLSLLQIPILSNELQIEVETNVIRSFEKLEQAKITYESAEQLLLNCLKMGDFHPPVQAVNIKPFSTSFGISGRLDAEFYQTKYEYYKSKIESYPNGFETVRTVCYLKDRNFTPQETDLYHYIEISNIGRYGEIIGSTLDQGGNLPSRARRKVMKNDVIISNVEGSLSSCAIVSEEYNQAICSTGFYVVSSDKINSETLLVLFKSEPLQQLLRQGCSGTILSAINKEEFLNIPLPLIKDEVQKQIADLIQKSSYFRIRSRELLDQAKKAIELAIEKNQDIALDFLKGNK